MVAAISLSLDVRLNRSRCHIGTEALGQTSTMQSHLQMHQKSGLLLFQGFRGTDWGTRREEMGMIGIKCSLSHCNRHGGPNGSESGTKGPIHISSSSCEKTIAHCVSKSKVATSLMRKQRRRGLMMRCCPWREERKTLSRGCRKAASASFCVHCKARASVSRQLYAIARWGGKSAPLARAAPQCASHTVSGHIAACRSRLQQTA